MLKLLSSSPGNIQIDKDGILQQVRYGPSKGKSIGEGLLHGMRCQNIGRRGECFGPGNRAQGSDGSSADSIDLYEESWSRYETIDAKKCFRWNSRVPRKHNCSIMTIASEGFCNKTRKEDKKTCREDYSIFSDVLTFDVMYGHNKYNLPIVVFSGVNHHSVFGTAMVSNESQESYIWVLQKVLECMQGKTPKVVIIDRDPAMKVAIQDVFPDANHRLCAWHLLRNATPILSTMILTQLFRLCTLANAEISEFEHWWDVMVEECGIREADRVNNLFVESKYGILEFVTNFHRCVDFLRDNEEELDFQFCFGTLILQTQFVELEKSAVIKFTREIFFKVKESLQ
ncbi:hypothetical protein AHAS_Ahas03G0125500 [Arachis hypogaea]